MLHVKFESNKCSCPGRSSHLNKLFSTDDIGCIIHNKGFMVHAESSHMTIAHYLELSEPSKCISQYSHSNKDLPVLHIQKVFCSTILYLSRDKLAIFTITVYVNIIVYMYLYIDARAQVFSTI